jgi:hypothetical protein
MGADKKAIGAGGWERRHLAGVFQNNLNTPAGSRRSRYGAPNHYWPEVMR